MSRRNWPVVCEHRPDRCPKRLFSANTTSNLPFLQFMSDTALMPNGTDSQKNGTSSGADPNLHSVPRARSLGLAEFPSSSGGLVGFKHPPTNFKQPSAVPCVAKVGHCRFACRAKWSTL